MKYRYKHPIIATIYYWDGTFGHGRELVDKLNGLDKEEIYVSGHFKMEYGDRIGYCGDSGHVSLSQPGYIVIGGRDGGPEMYNKDDFNEDYEPVE